MRARVSMCNVMQQVRGNESTDISCIYIVIYLLINIINNTNCVLTTPEECVIYNGIYGVALVRDHLQSCTISIS